MTAHEPVTPVCPECGGVNTMVFSDGVAHCFDDDHEWDPATVSALPRPSRGPVAAGPTSDPVEASSGAETAAGGEPAATVQTPTLPEVAAPPAVEPLGLAELVGGTARLEGGQVCTVLSFPDDEHVVVRMNDGRDETVALSDVEHITPRAPAYVVDPDSQDPSSWPTEEELEEWRAEHPDGPDDMAIPDWVADVQGLSNIMIQAGVATLDRTDQGLTIGEPPTDWLPRDEGTTVLVESAIGLSIARLIVGYDLDVDDILEGVQGDQPTEDTSD